MATGAQAIARIAEATGILPATVSRAARTLREADPLLWPEAGKGGGKRAAHVRPNHLVNLALALAVADPITSAPDVVLTYRNLTPQVSRSSEWSENRLLNSTNLSSIDRAIARNAPEESSVVTWLLGETLGEGLETLINFLVPIKRNALYDLAFPDAPPLGSLSDTLQRTGLTVVLTVGEVPGARVRGWSRSTDDSGRMKTDFYSSAQTALEAVAPPPPEAAFERETKLPFDLFKVLGELWGDTLAQQPDAGLSFQFPASVVPNTEQKNESAGSFPKEPTLSGYQPHDDDRMDTGTTRKEQASRNPDPIACVCAPSRGIEPEAGLTTSKLWRRAHDPASHHHALL